VLVTLGRRGHAAPTPAQLLVECHARIRGFCALARRLGEGAEASAAREAATALLRYFSIALPLHVADEEESLAPRLGRIGDRALESGLATMSAEHVELDAQLGELMRRWNEIIAQPTPERCAATGHLAATIAGDFERHLVAEEADLFPSLSKLAPEEASAIVGEMRARRAR
jgi:iron-sulfur cluster repair protein YtfE (RIC family)